VGGKGGETNRKKGWGGNLQECRGKKTEPASSHNRQGGAIGGGEGNKIVTVQANRVLKGGGSGPEKS